ncbi:hypothetical protein Tco_0722650 [Tanacetum coccineum]
MPTTRQLMSSEAIEELIAQCVADALATYETNRNTKNGNGNGNGNGSGSQSDGGNGSRKTVHTDRGCTYKEFLNYQPLNFTGFDGAVGLARWTVGHDAAYDMSWKDLMKMMTKAYCPKNKIQKLESELWNLTMKADDKRRMENNPRDDHVQQPPYKRQNVARAYTTGPGKKKEYARTLPHDSP